MKDLLSSTIFTFPAYVKSFGAREFKVNGQRRQCGPAKSSAFPIFNPPNGLTIVLSMRSGLLPGEPDLLPYHWAVRPPSITSSEPVTKDDSSEAR